MQYIWDTFNIKIFAANTFVFVDGVFVPDLSNYDCRLFDTKTYENTGKINILEKGKLPVHIIYVGEIIGDKKLDILLQAPNLSVFLTVKINTNSPAFLNINIQNTGKKAEFNGNILIQNKSSFKLNILNEHLASDTTIITNTKIVAHKNSVTELSGTAIIGTGFKNCTSDVGFSALCHKQIKSLSFRPEQYIQAEPASAGHSAAIWRATSIQTEYLRSAGLSGIEIDEILCEAFENSE